jgi:hypothetical protein
MSFCLSLSKPLRLSFLTMKFFGEGDAEFGRATALTGFAEIQWFG